MQDNDLGQDTMEIKHESNDYTDKNNSDLDFKNLQLKIEGVTNLTNIDQRIPSCLSNDIGSDTTENFGHIKFIKKSDGQQLLQSTFPTTTMNQSSVLGLKKNDKILSEDVNRLVKFYKINEWINKVKMGPYTGIIRPNLSSCHP